MFSAYRSYFASMKSSRDSYLIGTQKYIFRFSVLKPNFLAFRFHPLSSAPSFYLLSSYPSFTTSTPTNFIYLRIMVSTDWNYCTQLINSPIFPTILPQFYVVLCNYIFWNSVKSRIYFSNRQVYQTTQLQKINTQVVVLLPGPVLTLFLLVKRL